MYKVVEATELIQKIVLSLEAINNFKNLNNIEADDYFNLSICDVDSYSYIDLDLSSYAFDFHISGFVKKDEFIIELKELPYTLIKLDNNTIFIKMKKEKQKVLRRDNNEI